MLIELLVLLNVRLLDFLLALLVREDHLLVVHLKLLFFELSDAILRHFSLYSRTCQRIKQLRMSRGLWRAVHLKQLQDECH